MSDEGLQEIWWYSPLIHVIMQNLRPAVERLKIFKNPPLTKEDFLDKRTISKVEHITCQMYFFKLKNGCIEMDDFYPMQTLQNRIKELFPNLQVFDWLEEWNNGYESNITWKGFDEEILWPSSMRAEQSTSPQAIEFRKNRGFIWKFKETGNRFALSK